MPCARLVQFGDWALGLAICYDVEFPELVRSYALAGADAVLVPDGKHAALHRCGNARRPCARRRKRNLRCLCQSRVGREGAFEYCGLSCVVGPDGNDVARAGRTEELMIADISKETIAHIRSSLSHLNDRRSDLYPL